MHPAVETMETNVAADIASSCQPSNSYQQEIHALNILNDEDFLTYQKNLIKKLQNRCKDIRGK